MAMSSLTFIPGFSVKSFSIQGPSLPGLVLFGSGVSEEKI
jgi:hypothetical protein